MSLQEVLAQNLFVDTSRLADSKHNPGSDALAVRSAEGLVSFGMCDLVKT